MFTSAAPGRSPLCRVMVRLEYGRAGRRQELIPLRSGWVFIAPVPGALSVPLAPVDAPGSGQPLPSQWGNEGNRRVNIPTHSQDRERAPATAEALSLFEAACAYLGRFGDRDCVRRRAIGANCDSLDRLTDISVPVAAEPKPAGLSVVDRDAQRVSRRAVVGHRQLEGGSSINAGARC